MPYTQPIPSAVTGEVAPASLWNTYVKGNFEALDRDAQRAVIVGTSGGMGERWYWAGVIAAGATATSTVTPGTGALWSVPFTSPYGPRTLDRIAVNVTTLGASGLARLGIYAATSETDPYPGALVVDAGEFSIGSTGIKAQTISTALEPDTLYWATYICGTTAATLLALDSSHTFHPVMGISTTLANASADTHIRRTQTYGALPSTYPAGPPTVFGNPPLPAIGLRFSA